MFYSKLIKLNHFIIFSFKQIFYNFLTYLSSTKSLCEPSKSFFYLLVSIVFSFSQNSKINSCTHSNKTKDNLNNKADVKKEFADRKKSVDLSDDNLFSVIIVSAGSGTRFNSEIPKQFIKINNKLVVQWSVDVFAQIPEIKEIILVVNEPYLEFAKANIYSPNPNVELKFCIGGKLRQNSVANGLSLVNHNGWAIIHDAARPAISLELVKNAINCAKAHGNAIVAVKAKDTIVTVENSNLVSSINNDVFRVSSYLDRNYIYYVQTPQIFKVSVLKDAYDNANQNNIIATDDSNLVMQMGVPIFVVEGSYKNIKLTTKEDLVILQNYLFNNLA